ncbi:cobalt transporter CbiM [Aliiruegeria sabulilitoris]|uniref:cobalt transporter CbiM n=1 Tax=Aliiruegeria sabulilitoris TaxID=1510458 RepID=UPI0008337C9A|nr:cobalt transporter CbiM [Aliiruegeria sabulilitoris]NDR59058.1 cobalt transporter CbiM [Pseudoruegeria sp. M32A2M]
MHIVDGALSNPVVIAGAALTIGGLAQGLRKLPMEKIPVAGVLSATFFVASLIHVPVGPSSVHLIMNGLAGLVLGWAAFPALFVGLLLQAVFFGFGGLTVLGVNTLLIAGPAVLAGLLIRPRVQDAAPRSAAIWAAVAGGLAIALTTVFVALALAITGDEFLPAAKLVFFAHVPVMFVEAMLTGAAVYLAKQVKPELFDDLQGAFQ